MLGNWLKTRSILGLLSLTKHDALGNFWSKSCVGQVESWCFNTKWFLQTKTMSNGKQVVQMIMYWDASWRWSKYVQSGKRGRSVTSDVFWKCKCSFVYGGEVSVVDKGKMKVMSVKCLCIASCTEWSTWLWLQLFIWDYQYQVYGTEVDINKPILGPLSLQKTRHWKLLNYMCMHVVAYWCFNIPNLLLIYVELRPVVMINKYRCYCTGM